jgi:hypothetical protein
MFKKAERKQSKLRLAICGCSGSGKSYSSIMIAKGLCSNSSSGSKIAVIDTESGSSELYSHIADYDVAVLTPPFTPQRYIDLIHTAEKAGYSTLIIDSLSHAWQGAGGILEMHDKATTGRTNSFAAWGVVTPLHNALVEAILSSPLHIIATMRTKTAYEVVSENGRTKVNKLGLAPVQRENMEYEFTVVFDLLADSHTANVSKDRTGLFTNQQQFQPSEATGKKLLQWLESGTDQNAESNKLLTNLQSQISSADTLSKLKTVWQENEQDIDNQLIPEDIDTLKADWLSKKDSFINNHPSH